MRYYSTNNKNKSVDLKTAIIQGLADDNGLFMPEKINTFTADFFTSNNKFTFAELAFEVASKLFADDIPLGDLEDICRRTFNFEAPNIKVADNIYSLELFHGPTLAFKDVGARFMAAMLEYFTQDEDREINVLVATSGDTGGAVANGFLNKKNIKVTILYPSGKVSEIQEKQLTTLGQNITALEVSGTFDDCQRLVKMAFLDKGLKEKLVLTSANSINLARLLPQSFYYFYSYFNLEDKSLPLIFSVPSGNFGNVTAAVFAKRMGLPIHKLIAGVNSNDTFYKYLVNGVYQPKEAVATISNAMDVGNPSNFARLMDLYSQSHSDISKDFSAYTYTDEETRNAMIDAYKNHGYICDPHGAIGFYALKKYLETERIKANGIFLETAHPVKFLDEVERTLNMKLDLPEQVQDLLKKEKTSVKIDVKFESFKEFLTK